MSRATKYQINRYEGIKVMLPTRKNTCTSIAIATFLVIPNLLTASVVSANETVNFSQQISEQNNFIAEGRLTNSDGSCSIVIPGRVTKNTTELILSFSSATVTSYLVMFRDFPVAANLNSFEKRQMLVTAMRDAFGTSGVIIRNTDYEIDGHPGSEILMRHGDGTLGQYRGFIVNQRVYFLGAITKNKFTQESSDFFASFRIYPEKIRYSNSTSGIY